MSKNQLVFDPLYGQFEIPGFLRCFVDTPEFQRLSSVRLLNFESIELSALSEVRRLSHTLGVLHLGSRVATLGFNNDEIKALLFSILVHDVGTPPFAHTLEYEFIRRYDLNHEEIALMVLDAKHHTMNLDHQIFRDQSVALAREIEKTGQQHLIRQILGQKHPLSAFIFGDIDLDNIDNVFRMAMMLGRSFDRQAPTQIVANLDVNVEGKKIFPRSKDWLIIEWLECRRHSYRAILDTPRHRQNQAVFSRIVFEALEQDIVSREDWFLTDELLLNRLLSKRELRPFFKDLNRSGNLKEWVFGLVPNENLQRNNLMNHRDSLTELLEERLEGRVYVSPINYGSAISRRVTFVDPKDGVEWSLGNSQSAYRLHIFASLSATSSGLAKTEKIIVSVVNEYAEKSGWEIGSPEYDIG